MGLLLFLLISHSGIAAFDDAWLESRQDENGIMVKQEQSVNIEIDDGGSLVISESIYEETVHLKETARFFSEQSIGYSSTFTEIQDVEAYSLIPNERGKFKKNKVEQFNTVDAESEGIFYDDQKKITFFYPGLCEGARTVMSYRKIYKEPRLWGYYVFSSFFPVKESRYIISAPAEVKLKFRLYGIEEDRVAFSQVEKGGMVEYTWEANELDKIRLGSGAKGILHYAPHLIVYVDSYYANGKVETVLSGVDDLYQWYSHFIDMMEADDEPEELKSMVHDLVKDKPTEIEKVQAIYEWVQNNIKYIAYEDGLGGFVPRNATKVFGRRYGDCKDMSNLLKDMLGIAGINAHLTWIGTSAIPYTHRDVPTPMSDNHMICTYVQGGKYYFLDATDQFNHLGVPSSHIQGREAMVNMGAKGYELVNVPVMPYDQNSVIDSVKIAMNENVITGEGIINYKGYSRIPITYGMLNLDENDKKIFLNALLGKGHNKFQIGDYKTYNLEDGSKDLKIEYRFSLEDYLLSAGDEIYVNPHIDREFEDELIDMKRPTVSKQFSYKSSKKTIVEFEIPTGYKVDYLPEKVALENEAFGFTLDYIQNAETLIVSQGTFVNVLELETDRFEQWNNMIRGLLTAYKESVVLKRK